MYFPRYKADRRHAQYHHFCRVKLMLSHAHRVADDLLEVDGQVFESYVAVYEFCRAQHNHGRDGFGDPDDVEGDAEPDLFEPGDLLDDLALEDWQEIARMGPNAQPAQEDADMLGRRDIDLNYD